MDISKWAIEDVMRLPDYAFGERWPVSVHVRNSVAGTFFALSPAALPTIMVVWELSIYFPDGEAYPDAIRIFLADVVPASTPEVLACEALITGLGEPEAGPGTIEHPAYGAYIRYSMKKIVRPGGRKLGVSFFMGVGPNYRVMVVAVISSVPKEIPDWLAYHLGISR